MHKYFFADALRRFLPLRITCEAKVGAIALPLFFVLAVAAFAADDVGALRQKAEHGDAAA